MLSWSCGVCVCGVYMTVCVSLLSVVRVREESVRSIKPYSNPRSSPTVPLPGGSRLPLPVPRPGRAAPTFSRTAVPAARRAAAGGPGPGARGGDKVGA